MSAPAAEALAGLNQIEPVDRAKIRKLASADTWLPSGAVLKAFVLAPEPVTAIMGPFGSGKTIGSYLKGLLCSCVVPRSPEDGIRYARGLVVRDTYRNLELNAIPSWFERFPKDMGSFKGGGGGEPGKAVIDFELKPGEILHLEVIFAALGDHNVKQFCDGFQANWCFANALDALPREFMMFMRPRLGRWPPPQHRPTDWKDHVHRWRKLFGDMNAPDLDNWTYGDEEKKRAGFVEHVRAGWKLFTQPGGMEPTAENRENLPTDYYEEMIGDNEVWWVNRFVHNKFGYSRAGEPVYTEWNDVLHVAPADIAFDKQRKLILGLDAGRDPRAVAIQKTRMGGINVIDQLVPEQRMGAKAFGKLLSEWLADNFEDADIIAYADPAATYATQDSDEEDTVWAETVAEVAKIKVKPAPTNAIGPRLEAVRQRLTDMPEGKPSFQLSPRKCRSLRRGFNSGYRFPKTKAHGDEVTGADPVKNQFSHDHDALQYACLGSSDYQELKGRDKRRRESHAEPQTSWNPHE